MKWLTARQIDQAEFTAHTWRRWLTPWRTFEGYDVDEVDALLDRLADDAAARDKERGDMLDHIFNLEARIHELEGRLRWGREPLREAPTIVDQIAAPGPAGPQHLSARQEREPQPAPAVGYIPPPLAAQYAELEAATAALDVPQPRTAGAGAPVPEWPTAELGHSPFGDDLADELAAEAETHLRRHYESHDEWTMRLALESAQWQADARLRLAAA